MDADRPKFSINLPQYEQEQARTLYAVDFDMARARSAAEDARNADQNDARSRHQPHASEKAKAVWQGEGGSVADEKTEPVPTFVGSPWASER